MKAHPTTGGTYIRDPQTGALTRADAPRPAASKTEPAPPAAPETPKKGGK